MSQTDLEEWGSYAPETRKILKELQFLKLDGTAKRLAIAIDREYVRCKRNSSGAYVTYVCKSCGKKFRRQKWSPRSKEYCNDDRCRPKSGTLTWELVDEIRNLYTNGRLSRNALAQKYGVSESRISAVVDYRTWKPECDLRPRARFEGDL